MIDIYTAAERSVLNKMIEDFNIQNSYKKDRHPSEKELLRWVLHKKIGLDTNPRKHPVYHKDLMFWYETSSAITDFPKAGDTIRLRNIGSDTFFRDVVVMENNGLCVCLTYQDNEYTLRLDKFGSWGWALSNIIGKENEDWTEEEQKLWRVGGLIYHEQRYETACLEKAKTILDKSNRGATKEHELLVSKLMEYVRSANEEVVAHEMKERCVVPCTIGDAVINSYQIVPSNTSPDKGVSIDCIAISGSFMGESFMFHVLPNNMNLTDPSSDLWSFPNNEDDGSVIGEIKKNYTDFVFFITKTINIYKHNNIKFNEEY